MDFPLIYIYNFFLSFFLLIICKIKQLPKRSYLYLVTLYYVIIFGQRWFGGIDFRGYLEYYLVGKGRSLGYSFIQEIFRKNNIYFGLYIFCIYLFTTVVSLWFFRKFSKSNLGIFLFFLSEYHIMSINPLRTYIAINIFLLGVYFWEIKNKKILGIIFMCLSTSIHFLTIGAVIIYLILKLTNILPIKKIVNVFLIIIPLINIKPILKELTDIFLPMYSHYFGGYFDQPLSLLNSVRYYVILFLFLYLKRYLILENKNEKFILNGIYAFLLLMGSATYFGELHRIAYFYKIFEPIFFVYLLEKEIIDKKIKYIIILLFLLNYIGIMYKDMGTLRHAEFKRIHLYNYKTNEEYFMEIEEYLKKWE